jgi:CheY-like chemotaxis protein
LLNVVGNALKFTDFGTVQLEVTNAASLSATGAPQICFKVSDSGIGMGTEDSAMVFEPFSQAFTPSAERPRGRGLGLTIGHRIAAALGGSLQLVKTEIGEGSVFMLTVPVQPAAQDKSQKKRPQSQALANRLLGKVLLVAEDQFDILHLLQAHLEQAGARVLTAANGQEAVDLAKGHTIDLAIMDLQMPLLDGYEAAEKLRANGFKGPLLALSAHILDEHRAKALGLGFSAHLAKPVSAEHLIQAVESLLNGAPTSPSVKPTKS